MRCRRILDSAGSCPSARSDHAAVSTAAPRTVGASADQTQIAPPSTFSLRTMLACVGVGLGNLEKIGASEARQAEGKRSEGGC
jgi:hypothetical protein